MKTKDWARLEVVIVSAALLLMAFSLVLPEYKITTRSGTSGMPRETVQLFYFDVFRTETTINTLTDTDYGTYDATYPYDYSGVGHTLANERLWLACWMFLTWMLVAVLAFGREIVQVLVGWMTVIGGMVALVYPVIELTGSIPNISGFFGSSSSSGVSISWGPSSAWYIAIIAEALVGAAVVRRMNRFFMESREEVEEPEVASPLTDEVPP